MSEDLSAYTCDYLHKETSTSENGRKMKTVYLICGTADVDIALDCVKNAVLTDFPGWDLASADYSEALGPSVCKISVDLEHADDTTVGTEKKHWSFSAQCSGKTITCVRSIGTIKSDGAPDHSKIGYDPEARKYNGVQVETPEETISWTLQIDLADYSQEYRKTLRSLLGKLNNAKFQGYEAFELLYVGHSINYSSSDSSASITYNFKAGVNETQADMGDAVFSGRHTAPVKAWDYVWMYEDFAANPQTGKLELKKYTYISTVFQSADFSKIKL